MGIPKLFRDLEPYRESAVLGTPNAHGYSKQITRLVIDGPGLVYFVYYRLLSLKDLNLNPLDAQPSYAEISRAILELLQFLRLRCVEVEKIYFDGVLPETKRDVRGTRMERSRVRLEAFCKAYPGPYGRSRDLPGERPFDVLEMLSKSTPVSRRFSALPEPPFMVPAVMEHLTGSNGELSRPSLVELVPGEAEIYCAAYARQTGATILSNDSDTVVFDLGQEGCILLLDSLDVACIDGRDHILGSCLTPQKIADKFGLDSLSLLAFERSRDMSVPFHSLLAKVKKSPRTEDNDAYKTFMAQYTADRFTGLLRSPFLPLLDVRTAELYHQISTPRDNGEVRRLQIYLPIMIENHSRLSSWNIGTNFRVLGYSLLAKCQGSKNLDTVVDEYMRTGARIAPQLRKLLDDNQIPVMSTTVVLWLRNARRTLFHLVNDECWYWRLLGMYHICQHLESTGKPILDKDWVAEFLLTGYVGKQISLDGLHVEANMQAALYSLRMLNQLIIVAQTTLLDSLALGIADLQQDLQTMPCLSELMKSRMEIFAESRRHERLLGTAVAAMYTLVEDHSHQTWIL